MRAHDLIAVLLLFLLPMGNVALGQPPGPMHRVEPVGNMRSAFPEFTDGFMIVRPVDGLRIGRDTAQAIVALWRDAGVGIDGASVEFETTFGELSDVRVDTDALGFAVVFLRSSEAGEATVTATSAGGDISAVTVSFVEGSTSEASYRSGGRDIPLTIFQNRIGIQLKSGSPAGSVFRIAANERMEVRQAVSSGIYELEFDRAYSLDSLQHLARRLETQYAADVQQAGIVVRTAPEKAPMLLTGQVLVGFGSRLTDDQVETIRDEFRLASLEPLAEGANIYVATIEPEYQWDIFRIANRLADHDAPPVRFAHPNFVIRTLDRQGESPTADVPCVGSWPVPGFIDPYYCQQWHHDNRGLENGVIDADIDTPQAWELTTGANRRPRVAVIDSGFFVTHPDLAANLWHDPDDGTPGRSFFDSDHTALVDDPNQPKSHGTSVAGIVGAVAHNTEVGRGVCPDCELLLIRNAESVLAISQTFYFATAQNADVISNSWEPPEAFDAMNVAIEQAAVGHDTPIVFAAPSVKSEDRCNDPSDLSSIDEHVIAVSSSTYLDDRTPSGMGNCIDVLAPSRRGQYNGIVTTAVLTPEGSTPYSTHTSNFGGTSAAAPIVSGTIGLMLDANPNLSRLQIQHVLQDTADRIDPAAGAYDAESGYSRPTPGPATHAYGRINAFEAVSLVAPFDPSETDLARRGHGGMDLMLRDHALDFGNTERPSCELFTPSNPRQHTPVAKSVDIKLDMEPFQEVEETLEGFHALTGEEPEQGRRARAYVRIRNRGPVTVPHAWVKLHWTMAFPLPALQDDFWVKFPEDADAPSDPQSWNPLEAKEIEAVAYSGPSVAGCPDRTVPDCLPIGTNVLDPAQVVVFGFGPLTWDAPKGERLSLLAMLHSEDDPVVPKLPAALPHDFSDSMTATVWDNNVALWMAGADNSGEWCPF